MPALVPLAPPVVPTVPPALDPPTLDPPTFDPPTFDPPVLDPPTLDPFPPAPALVPPVAPWADVPPSLEVPASSVGSCLTLVPPQAEKAAATDAKST
jgi:endoglucanase